MAVCNAVADSVFDSINRAGSVSDDQLSILHFLYGKNLERALRIVDLGGVKRIAGEASGRALFLGRKRSGERGKMRLKKHKRNRKVVRFYSTCYGFREPFKVLCDGTFLHHLVFNKLGSPQEVLSSLLSARAMLFTTRCIISELKRLEESFSESLKSALSLTITKCEHPNRVSASNCVEAIVKDNNSYHFFVASQDADLRKTFREIPGVPAIYAIRNSLFLDQPSACHLQFVRTAEKERLHMKDLELETINRREKRSLSDQALGDGTESIGDAAKGRDVRSTRTSWAFNKKDKSKFKRKRAKGPNPLSCKKKKNSKDPAAA